MKKLQILFVLIIIFILYLYNVSIGQNLFKDDTLPPIPTYSFNYCFGDAIGDVVDVPDEPSIRSNLAPIKFHTDSSYNCSFSFTRIEPGITIMTDWQFSVVDLSKDARAIITFSDMKENDTTILLEYFAPKLIINMNRDVDFGKMMIDSIVTRDILIENQSTKRVIVLSEIKRKLKSNNLTITGIKLPYHLEPKSKAILALELNATKEGLYIDTLSFIDTCGIENKLIIKASVENPSNIIYMANELNEIISLSPIPVNEIANIKLNFVNNTPASLIIYDNYGRLVKTIIFNEVCPKGILDLNINLSNFPSGVYCLIFKQGTISQVKKFEILK